MFWALFIFSYFTLASPSSVDQALQWAKEAKVFEQKKWQKLMHFEGEGQLDSPVFYLASDGQQNLHNELLATIEKGFATLTESEEQSVICRFPGRWNWLTSEAKKAGLTFPQKDCPRYQKFATALKGVSVSLVFSSYYLNNPSSVFGHTFLRINKAPAQDGKRYELLDYGLNYAANADTSNPILYAFRGLFGGFKGVFSAHPYYYKVREYNQAERRDLWEFELTLTPEEVDFLIAHLWELGPTYADYWYLTENCSYHSLSILEAVRPELDLLSRLRKFVIPVDTLQVVWQTPGLVKRVDFRPSVQTELKARLGKLDTTEGKIFLQITKTKEFPKSFEERAEMSQQRVLDALLDWVDAEYPIDVQQPESKMAVWKNQVLARRSKLSVLSPVLKIPIPENEKPHLSHGTGRWGFGGQSSDQIGTKALFSYRFALHDFLDPVGGYPDYASITVGDAVFFYSDRHRNLGLEKFTLVEVFSLNPWSFYSKPISWQMSLGSKKFDRKECLFCQGTYIEGGVGVTFGGPRFKFFTGVSPQLVWATEAVPRRQWDLTLGPRAITSWFLTSKVHFFSDVKWLSDVKDGGRSFFETGTGLQWNLKQNALSVRVSHQKEEEDQSWLLNIYKFF